jgi:hypothetical protein
LQIHSSPKSIQLTRKSVGNPSPQIDLSLGLGLPTTKFTNHLQINNSKQSIKHLVVFFAPPKLCSAHHQARAPLLLPSKNPRLQHRVFTTSLIPIHHQYRTVLSLIRRCSIQSGVFSLSSPRLCSKVIVGVIMQTGHQPKPKLP